MTENFASQIFEAQGDEVKTLRLVFDILDQISTENQDQRREDTSWRHQMQTSINHVEIILGGIDGKNGLKSQVDELEDRFEHCAGKETHKDLLQTVKRLDIILTGIDGANGVRKRSKNNEREITVLKDTVKLWLTRMMTAYFLGTVIIVPLILWIFQKYIIK